MTDEICWQYKKKKAIEIKENGNSPKIDLNKFEIKPINYKSAKEFIMEYEWVGNMGTSKYCFGLLFNNILASVVCYGPSVAPSKYSKTFGLENVNHLLQLCRGASTYWAPKWAPSKLITQSLKQLYKELGILVVVAYADPIAGEIGTIYQACNALYIGETVRGGGKKYIINGHTYDPRKAHKKFGSLIPDHLSTIDPNYSTIPIFRKHRYIFLLGSKKEKKQIFERIRHLVKPHPKRKFKTIVFSQTTLSILKLLFVFP